MKNEKMKKPAVVYTYICMLLTVVNSLRLTVSKVLDILHQFPQFKRYAVSVFLLILFNHNP